jgi:phage shock protein PspC (stress-responsive transcriptional regulator)
MKKVININFQGRILPIEEVAYESLKQYVESLRVYFEKEEGSDEIINDIECRIAELCDDRLKKGTACITEEDIQLIISSIGRPADFEAQDGFEASTSQSQYQDQHQNTRRNDHSYHNASHTAPKRLFRDEHNKVLGGVCSGIANYFGVEPLLIRILWFFLIGVNILGYLILWVAVPSSSVKEVGGVRKRLFRDVDNKVIGGVASGLSKYFGIQVWIIRVLFLIPFFRFLFNFNHLHLFQFWEASDFGDFLDITFSPGAVFVYIVLWLVIPEAKTSADKLEMVGEKVDINSIKNTIQNDMEGFGNRAKTWGDDLYQKTTSFRREQRNARREERYFRNESRNAGSNFNDSADEANSNRKVSKGCLYYVGRIITIAVKGFVYFILAIVGVSLVAALFGVGVAATSLLPLKNFVLEEGIQSWYAIGAILLFIWVPAVGIVTAIVRKIAGYKKANIWVRSSFWALWILGWLVFILFFNSLGKSFSKHNVPEEQNLALSNAKISYLEVTAKPKMKYYEDSWFSFTPFSDLTEEDTLFVRNLKIRIVQSKTDSFEIKVVKLSNGKSVADANALAQKINFDFTQRDSLLFLDKGIHINKTDKFRNQHIIMTIAVPVGKRIKINNKGWSQTNIKINKMGIRTETFDRISSDENWFDEWNESWDNESFEFEHGVEYVMTATGLEKTNRQDAVEESSDDLNKSSRWNKDSKNKMDEVQKEIDALREERKRLEELKKENKSSINNGSVTPELGKVGKVVSRIGDLQWIVERFTY